MKVYLEMTDVDHIDLLWHILCWCVDECEMSVDDLRIVNGWIAKLEDLEGDEK